MKQRSSKTDSSKITFAGKVGKGVLVSFASFATFAVKALDRKVRKGLRKGVKADPSRISAPAI